MNAFLRSLALAALLAAPPLWAQVTVAGVKFEPAAQVGGSTLTLNGAGVRTKFVFKVYAMGLYLPQQTPSAEQAIAAPGARRISLSMLREVDAAEFAQAFAKGMTENNDQALLARLLPSVQRMNQLFANQTKLVTGDKVVIDSVPGTGTLIRIKGAPAGEPFQDADFFPAMLRIWLGAHPADTSLKDALLGKPAG